MGRVGEGLLGGGIFANRNQSADWWAGPNSLWGTITGQSDPNQIGRDLTYQVDTTGLDFASQLGSDVDAQRARGQGYDKRAGGFFDQAQLALDPSSQYNQSILGMINEQAGRQSADTLAQQNMFTQRNQAMVGGGSGIAEAQGRAQASQATGQLAQQRNQTNLAWMQSLSGRAGQIASIGQGLAGTASQAFGQAGSLQGQQAGLYGQYSGARNQMLGNRAQGIAQAGISNRQQSANMINSLLSFGLQFA